jgi:hypothetical protein
VHSAFARSAERSLEEGQMVLERAMTRIGCSDALDVRGAGPARMSAKSAARRR